MEMKIACGRGLERSGELSRDMYIYMMLRMHWGSRERTICVVPTTVREGVLFLIVFTHDLLVPTSGGLFWGGARLCNGLPCNIHGRSLCVTKF